MPKQAQALVDAAKTGGPLKDGETTEVKIILWSNGFQVTDDGPLRDYKDPANKAFMDELMQ